MLSYLQAIWMGIVQGLTEFLPVSSSAHLVIIGKVLGVSTDGGAFFEALLHVATVASICGVFYKDVWSLIRECVLLVIDGVKYLSNREEHPFEMYPERRMALLVIAASIPTAVIGLLVQKFLEDLFLSSLVAVGMALMITGVLLYVSRYIPKGKKNSPERVPYRYAWFIGFVQGIATIPGISRSGSTITAGKAGGFTNAFAVKFSFLISIPAVIGAALLSLVKGDAGMLAGSLGPCLLGMVIAAAVGYVCLRLLLRVLEAGWFYRFGYYCAGMGLLCFILGFVL